MKNKKCKLDVWRNTYCYVLPLINVVILFIISLIRGIKISALCDGKYYNDMLTAVITYLSIVLSVFGVLIPAIMGSNNNMVKYFFENADIEKFSRQIKNIFISGIINVLFTSLLFLFDVLNKNIIEIILYVWVILLGYFSCNAYRFISIMIGILLRKKETLEEKRKVAYEVSEQDVEAFNNSIRKINRNI